MDMMTKILLVEDDTGIVENLKAFLRKEGFAVDAVPGQQAAMLAVEETRYDLLLLDVSLADGNGYAVCKAVKERGDTPVIFLTASDDEYSVVNGFDVGADDYVAKPFRPRELVSRMKNVLRRFRRMEQTLEYGGLVVDPVKGTVSKRGADLYLSALEYRLLLVFLGHKGMVLSRNRLLEEIWDAAGDYVNDNTRTVYIKRLRDKIADDPQNPSIIKTVRGLGYRVGDGT